MQRPRGRASRPATALLVLLTLLLASCTVGPSSRPALATSGTDGASAAPTSTSAVPTGPGGPGRTSPPVQFAGCPDQVATVDPATGAQFTVECGSVDVPKTYDGADAGTLSIAVTRARGASTPGTAPSLLVLRGFPGAVPATSVAAVAGSLPAAVRARYSIVMVDLRGTGDSAAIDCVSGSNSQDLLSLGADPTTTTASTLLADLSRSLTFDCGDLVGPELSDYSTVLAADDLDTLRAALGTRTLDVLGQGFGGTLGAVYADRYPGRVGRMVLDGPSDPALAPDKQALATAVADEKALSTFAGACATFDGGCPLGADPAGEVRALVTRLGDIGSTSSGGQQVTGGTVVQALVDQLGTPAGWPQLAKALAAARDGDADPVADIVDAALGTDDVSSQQAARLVYQCNDSAQRLGGTELGQAAKAAGGQAPTFGPYLVGRLGICSSWPAPETPLGRVTATGAPPILVVGAVDDPVAPYSSVQTLTTQLDSATLLTWQSGQSGSYPASSCVTAAVDAYLTSGKMPASGTLCPP